jgi:steroid delta-isomerase-like uncharacterized protein
MNLTIQDKDTSENIEVVTRFELAFRAGDQNTIDELADPGLVDHNSPDGDPTLASFKKKVSGFKAIFPDLHEDLADIVASGDTVATRWVLSGTQQLEFMGVPAAGQTISVEGMNFYRVKDGRVTDLWTQFDTVALMQQVGAMPTSPAEDQGFQTTINLSANPETVFEALTSISGISSWWGPASGSGTAGGELTFTFGEHLVRFAVTDAVRANSVRWQTVSCDVLPDWVGTTISFDLSPADNDSTTLRFRHAGLRPELACYEQCSRDWGHFLHSSLVAYVETGTGHPAGS